jgi:hypothetical protein
MDRAVALLAVAVSLDIYLFDGRFTQTAEHVIVHLWRGLGL